MTFHLACTRLEGKPMTQKVLHPSLKDANPILLGICLFIFSLPFAPTKSWRVVRNTSQWNPEESYQSLQSERLVFAVIGDYGLAGPAEESVAELIKSWNPDLIVTTGDNNYPRGSPDTIDQNIGQYFHEFIYPYKGEFGPGASSKRFFPVL